MTKYQIINELKKGGKTAKQLSELFDVSINTIRGTIARLINDGNVISIGSDDGYIYKLSPTSDYANNDVIDTTNEYKEGFEELFKFFIKIVKNHKEIIKDVKKWNEMLETVNKEKIYKLGEDLV